MVWNKNQASLIITRYSENLLKTTEKAKADLQERLRMSMSNIFSVKFIKRIIISDLWTLIKSEFNIDVGRTRIVEILNSNAYKYWSPILRVKMKYNAIRLNWCERHIIETCFPDLFFSDESTFYLDNPVGARWLRVRKTIYMQKIKEGKLGHGL